MVHLVDSKLELGKLFQEVLHDFFMTIVCRLKGLISLRTYNVQAVPLLVLVLCEKELLPLFCSPRGNFEELLHIIKKAILAVVEVSNDVFFELGVPKTAHHRLFLN